MKVKLSDFPHQPGALPCCRECEGKRPKDCQPDPMKCTDFYIHNKAFIDGKLAAGGEDPDDVANDPFFYEWLIIQKGMDTPTFNKLAPTELAALQTEYAAFKKTLRG